MTRVLIVDDEPDFRSLLHRTLEQEGYDVDTASDDRGAIAAALRAAPDVLIVDLMLHGETDGLELARALRTSSPDLATMLITGYPSPQLEAQMSGLEPSAFLAKPFLIHELLVTLQQLIEQRVDGASLGTAPPRIAPEGATSPRVARCLECGEHLPLVRSEPTDGMTATWTCSHCGATYAGIVEDDADGHVGGRGPVTG